MERRCETSPDVAMFTTAINMQARSRSDGSARGALQILARMKASGCAPTAVTLNSVIDAQSKQADGSAKIAVTILDAMRRSTIAEVRPTVVTYTSVIDCQAKCADGDGRTAVALLEEMITEGVEPNHMTFGCCMNAQAKRGSARMASSILRRMTDRGLVPSYKQFNAVLDAQAKCADGSAREALEVLADMKRLGGRPNGVSYSTAIDAQAKKPDGSAAAAARLFEELVADGFQPDTVTFAGVIDSQAKCADGSAEVAAAIVDKMSAVLTPNLVHFNSALNACANQRPAAPELAARILAQMVARRMVPTQYTMSALLRCAGFAQPAQPELARQWFAEFAAGLDEVNDHVARALRGAVGDQAATELIGAAGHVEPQPTNRRNSSVSPPLRRRGSSRPSLSLSPPPVERRPSTNRASDASSWRGAATVERRPSSSLFSATMRVARSGSSTSLAAGDSSSWRERSSSASSQPSDGPSPKLFSQPHPRRAGSGSGPVSRRGSAGELEIPSDLPVSAMGRRGSSQRLQSRASAPVLSGLSGLSGGLSSISLGPKRLSLTQKVKAIRSLERPSTLLAPDFFASAPVSVKATASNKSRRTSVVREPCGPDGTRGFSARRTSADPFKRRSSSADNIGAFSG
jgi:pentatricopeptide repeat protein